MFVFVCIVVYCLYYCLLLLFVLVCICLYYPVCMAILTIQQVVLFWLNVWGTVVDANWDGVAARHVTNDENCLAPERSVM